MIYVIQLFLGLLQIALLQIKMCGHLFHENLQTFNRLPPIHSQHMSNLQMSKVGAG